MCEPQHGHDYSVDAKREAGDRRKYLNGNGNTKMWEWAWRFITVLFLPWMVWITVTLIGIQTDVAVIKGNRFTSDDALSLWQAIDKKADEDEVPPQWFLDRFNRLEAEVHELKR